MTEEVNTYDTIYLIDRLYEQLNQNSELSNKKKISLVRPEVSSANKKTYIKNFKEMCQRLNREMSEVQKFFEDELIAKSSIDAKGALIISGMFKQNGIQKILLNYIKQFVICKECGNGETALLKENRILFLDCKKCLSKKAIF